MLSCRLPVAILLALVAPALPVRAAETDSAPSVVLRVRSLDTVLEDARYLVTHLGKGEEAKQFDGFVRSMIGPKGLEGIDPKKPFGVYGTIGPNGIDSEGVLLLPIADEKAFLGLLERFDLKVEAGAGGLYSFTPPKIPVPVTVYFRFANGYVYATAENKDAVAKAKLRDPADVFPANLTAALSGTVRFDRIPAEIKQMFLVQMVAKVADAKRTKLKDETDVQQEFRAALLEDFSRRTKQLMTEGSALSFRLSVDRKAGEITVESSLTGKPDSKLATEIAELSHSRSIFAAVAGSDSAFNLLLHAGLTGDLRKAMEPVIDEGMQLALKKEQDEKRRAVAEKFLKAVAPTMKMGEFDGGMSIRGPGKDGKYSLLVGIKLVDGDALEKSFRALVKDLREEEQAKIKFDVDKAGAIKIHMLDIQKDVDAKTQSIFGDNQLYMAFRGDAWFLAGGEGGLALLKEALASKPKEAPQFQFEMAVKRVAPVLAKTNKDVDKALDLAFGKDSSSDDKVRITVEGGKTLRARMVVPAAVVKFFAEIGRSKKEPAAEEK